jgi:hypothetical protein
VALEVKGVPVLTRGDFNALINGLGDDGPSIEPLAAWLVGEEISPEDLHDCLDIACRARAVDDLAHRIIDVACERLERSFPGRVL